MGSFINCDDDETGHRSVASNSRAKKETAVPPDLDSYKSLRTGSSETNQQPVCERKHFASTVALCSCTFIQAYLLISVFPYAGYLVIELVSGLDEESAGSYAGLIASSFMLGRTFSSYLWGIYADRYGRRNALILSLILSGFFSLLFGVSQNFWSAMVTRFFLGFSNGIQGTAKTLVTELAYGDEKLETRGTGLVIGMRSYGFLLSPAIGGVLADPLRQYPASSAVKSFAPLLSKFPFILPNLVGALMCMVAIFFVTSLVEETLPEDRRRDSKFVFIDLWCYISKKMFYRGTTERVEKRHLLSPTETEGRESFVSQDITSEDDHPCMSSIWKRSHTRQHLQAYWLFSFVVVCVDEAFPLFCISKNGGLALSEASIGKMLSAAGFIFVLGQYLAFAALVTKLGLYNSLTIGTLFGVPVVILIPLSVLLNCKATDGRLTWAAFLFLSVLMAVSKIFSCLFFAGITMATNHSVPTNYRATTNGLAMLGGSVAKGLGPIFTGLLVSFSMSSGVVNPRYGSVLIFSIIGILGLAVVLKTATLSPRRNIPGQA
mmetsp:Transcript_57798/g.172521  ORF Transcript_57798/g.172521 Transcript_57798/m.172521 type:complete len:547 (-) Transcript_57798:118-1758(-)